MADLKRVGLPDVGAGGRVHHGAAIERQRPAGRVALFAQAIIGAVIILAVTLDEVRKRRTAAE